MRATTVLRLLAPLGTLAYPTLEDILTKSYVARLDARQAPVQPPPCEPMVPAPTQEELEKRFEAFAKAFIYEVDIAEAFTYINAGYINHNPAATNGPDSAWRILGPIWNSLAITPIRTKIEGNMSWVNYRSGAFGEVVDRFRWEDGCIAEHWDQGERFPEN